MDFQTIFRLTNKKPKDKAENGNILGIKLRKKQDRFSFVVRCLESYSNPKGHIASIMFPGVEFLNKQQEEAMDVWGDLLGGHGYQWKTPKSEEVLVKCSCPAFLFYGSEFYASQFGYHIDGNTENRPPVIRDPDGNRYLCKHLIRVYKYIEKISFDRLLKRFKMASENLQMASLEEDILPAIADYLPRIGVSPEESKEVIASIDNKNLEDVLEKYGILVSNVPNQFDKINDKENINSLLEKEILK